MIKLQRLYSSPSPRGEKWPIGWKTPDGRFVIEYKKNHGDTGWWYLQDHSGRKLSLYQKEHDSLRDARECIEAILEEEAGAK